MTPMISKLYQAKNGGSLSHQECQQINAELAILKAEEIPPDQRENVAEYLTNTLNHNSVEPRLTSNLDDLLEQLQQNA